MEAGIKTILAVIGFMCCLVITGELFRAYTILFLIPWILIPFIMLVTRHSGINKKLHRKSALNLRNSTMAIVVAISVLYVIHLDYINNSIGYRYISGYSSHYEQDTDDSGRPMAVQEYTTTNPSDKYKLWALDGVIISLGILLPLLNWKQCNAIYESISND